MLLRRYAEYLDELTRPKLPAGSCVAPADGRTTPVDRLPVADPEGAKTPRPPKTHDRLLKKSSERCCRRDSMF